MEILAAKITKRVKTKLTEYDTHRNVYNWQNTQRIEVNRPSKSAASLLGELIVCNHFSRKNGLHRKDVILKKDEFGKTYVANDLSYHFNISHSGSWVVCAFDKEPIGVDIELIENIDNNIMERFYSALEISHIRKYPLDQRVSWFYKIWTLKESYLKALGIGIRVPLKSFSFIFNNNMIQLLSDIDDEKWCFQLYCVDPIYEIAVCKKGTNFPRNVQIIDENILLEWIY